MNAIRPDSAGIIYPYVKNKTRNAEFRIEAELDENVDAAVLMQAVADIRKRFPTFFVKLRTRNRMFVLEPTDECGVVEEERIRICDNFDFENDVPFRITFYKNRVAMEVFHTLSDGHGALIFFKTLLARYYNLKGCKIESGGEILSLSDAPKAEETGDAFLEISEEGSKKVSRTGSFAYQYCEDEPKTNLNITQLKISADEVHKLAKKYNTTVGIFLISVYIYAFYSLESRRGNKDIKISVPADLRKIFNKKTLRNFSLYATVGISPKRQKWTLEKIISAVSKQMAEQLNKKLFADMAYTNVSSANMKLFEMLPIPLKKAVLRIGIDLMGERLFTSAFSNIGIVEMPEELKAHVKDIKLFIGEVVVNRINITVTTYNGFINIVFSSIVENNGVQRRYAEILKDNGITVDFSERRHSSRDYKKIG